MNYDSQYRPGVLFWAAAAAVPAMVIGGLGPWARTLHFSANGTEGDGWVMIVVGALVAACLVVIQARGFVGKGTAAGLLLAGAVVTFTSLYEINGIANLAHGTVAHGAVNPAWGIYLSLVGGILLGGVAAGVLVGVSMFEPVPPDAQPQPGWTSGG